MKLAGRPVLCRLVQLDRMIRTGAYPNARSAARELEVSVRTVKRDFDLLRDSWGAPLEFSRPHNGYYYRDKDFTLPLLRLSEGELLAFYLCAHLLPALRGTPYERALQHAFDKLTLALPAEVSVLPERLAESVAIVPAAVTPQDAKIFDTLCRAVGERRRVDLDYWTASRDTRSRRLVDPYRLVLIGETWYLIGYCYTRQRVLEFAVGRVRGVRPTPQTFAPPEGFDLQKYLAGSFRGWRGEGHYRVVLRFPPAVAGRAAEKMWHAGQTTELEASGSLRMTLELSDLQEVMRWVLSWGAECAVLEPAELRTMVTEALVRMQELYAARGMQMVRSP